MSSTSEVTLILEEAKKGSEKAYDTFFPLIYNQ